MTAKGIITEWHNEVMQKYGDSGHTIITIYAHCIGTVLIETSAYTHWMGAQNKLFRKYKAKLDEIGKDVHVEYIQPNTINFRYQ